MKLALSVLRIFSRDWQRSADFYERVLELPCQFRDEDMGWARFDAGAASLSVRLLTTPERQPWGGMLAHFEDPDGNVLTLLGEGGGQSDG